MTECQYVGCYNCSCPAHEIHSQSFLYFGVGTPCGFRLPGADKILIPDYTPQLYIFPQMDDLNVFRFWSLQLLSITLLEPMIDCPDYEMDDPFQWTPKTIPLGVSDEQGPSGIRVIFDSGMFLVT